MKKNSLKRKERLILWVALFSLLGSLNGYSQLRVENFSFTAYENLNLPDLSSQGKLTQGRKIKIAIIDDGFNLDHELIKPFLSKQNREIPGNRFDDDENGYVDDVYGWNVSDGNGEVSVVQGREKEFYHGTMIATIISTVFLEAYDSIATEYLELIPIKAVSNKESNTYIKDGYKGISYAIARNVDIICCAWSGGELSTEQRNILEKATSKGILILGSAGNHYNNVLSPAANPNVIAVSAIDSNEVLIPTSNSGVEIDFVARGDEVRAGHPLDTKAYFYGDGTSAATALVTGVYGVVWSQYPTKTKKQITEAIKYTSKSMNNSNPRYVGRLGAGIPQAEKAIIYLRNPMDQTKNFNAVATEGSFNFYYKNQVQSYTVNPQQLLYGFELQVDPELVKYEKVVLEIKTTDSTFLLAGTDPYFFKKQLIVGESFTVKNISKKYKKTIRVTYQTILVDSGKLYCKDIKFLNTTGTLTDGSKEHNYSNKCDCKWLIKAPANKKIRLQFIKMDTQGNTDFIWVFAGARALNENLLAKFSGENRPPIITSNTNEVLLWFVSDNTKTGSGWELVYTWVD